MVAMPDNEKRALESSWKKMAGSSPDEMRKAGTEIWFWLFDNVPNMLDRFPKFKGHANKDAFLADQHFLGLATSVTNMLDTMVKSVGDPGKFDEKLKALAQMHLNMKPPNGSQYFGPLADRFHTFVETKMGYAPGSDEVKAWTSFMSAVNQAVKAQE